MASVAAALQNVVGGGVAWRDRRAPADGRPGRLGDADGRARPPVLRSRRSSRQAGVAGAATLAVSAAMVGIVAGGLLGGPDRHVPARAATRRCVPGTRAGRRRSRSAGRRRAGRPGRRRRPPAKTSRPTSLLKHLVAIARGGGRRRVGECRVHGDGLDAARLHRRDDRGRASSATSTTWPASIGLSQRTIDDLGIVALSLFLVMALMTLRLWRAGRAGRPAARDPGRAGGVRGGALPGRGAAPDGPDYDAVVMSGGFCGFMLGTTANAVANMGALVERYGRRRRRTWWCRWSGPSASTS